MFKCILGERKSGKSVHVENVVKGKDTNALYIATLPRLRRYQEIINTHRKRRPSTWECVELIQMSKEDILAFPYLNYRNVILDNLSYYVFFMMYFKKAEFMKNCDERIFSLIDMIAVDSDTTFYFVDTPIHQDMFETVDDNGIIKRLFTGILDKAAVIERYCSSETVCPMTVNEGKKYLLYE